jgi:transketolase
MPTIKSIDIEAVDETGCIITAENNNIHGGLGSAVAEVLGEHASAPMVRVRIRDCYGECGGNGKLPDKYACLCSISLKQQNPS